MLKRGLGGREFFGTLPRGGELRREIDGRRLRGEPAVFGGEFFVFGAQGFNGALEFRQFRRDGFARSGRAGGAEFRELVLRDAELSAEIAQLQRGAFDLVVEARIGLGEGAEAFVGRARRGVGDRRNGRGAGGGQLGREFGDLAQGGVFVGAGRVGLAAELLDLRFQSGVGRGGFRGGGEAFLERGLFLAETLRGGGEP